ncbi:MAG: ArsR family transcriptional regulator [Acidimicrobiaceae bacterium]|nr:ArsR family transcriptional regulator [Acidimicrobiaceae bacterium]
MSRTLPQKQVTDPSICCTPMSEESLSSADSEDLAAVFAALGDPVRLRLFSIISATGEVCSCNLEGPLERSQPTVSHHTKILAEAGLIAGDKRGRWVWWHVVPERLDAIRSVLSPSGANHCADISR